jgi:PAS domain S-box-containing protein
VVKEGKTVHANVSDTVREFLPRPLAYLISKTMGYDKKSVILTPLYRQRKVTGVLAMSCTDLCEYFTHSVENLALHISTALELAHKHAQRNRAVQALKRYHDHLGELVEERTAELKTVNEKLRVEISERKQAEEALQPEKNKLQSLIDAMEDGLSIQDKDYNIIYQGKLQRRISGAHLGEKCYRVYEGEEKVCDGCPVEKAFRDGKSHTAERRVVLPSGEVIFWENTANPVRDAEGKIVSCLEVTRNITERKQAEEELKLRAQVLDGATDSIFLHDFDGNFIYVNEAACRTHGYSREEFMKMKLHQVIALGRVSRLDSDFQEMLEKGQVIFESAHLRKDGSIMPAEVHGRTIESGERKLLLTVVRDITERKRAEEKEKQMRQELYLAQRLASVGELAAGVAHEINNPLTGVLGFSQRLMRKSTDEALSRDLEIIHSEARRAAEVVQNLLTFARRRQPKKEYSNINDIMQKTLELRSYALQTGNIEVVTALAPGLPRIMVDFPQMQEVFLNIILNAEQAMSEAHGRGKLIIKTREIKDYVRISLADDGPGISPKNLDKVFDPFFTTREGKGGTGLGLSACHGIVTEHGGRIYARSKAGKGATFFVELPLSPVEATLAPRS